MKLAQMEITQTQIPPRPLLAAPRFWALAAERLGVLWRSVLRRTGSRNKTLAVRETVALGDRRFVSVIQFESQRFLIGSGPSAITLLASLTDVSTGGEENARNGDKN
ncbi:MAG: flagellar biosynthetic protein FliO [Terriglobales bacterium]